MEVKVSITITLQGSQFINGKEVEKEWEEICKNRALPREERRKIDLKYHNLEYITINDGKKNFQMPVFTRKQKQAEQIINSSREAYEYMISGECPAQFKAPFNFGKDVKNPKNRNQQFWDKMSQYDRLKYHLSLLAESLNGELKAFEVFDD